ncbi:MAG: YihY/virulence factor BrkB family protein [Candidatus Marinimicrobia bacterium]|nr:YihY/virulence factor BrkB family protein [Candidatus Neomarinimicrobiota bacterium]
MILKKIKNNIFRRLGRFFFVRDDGKTTGFHRLIKKTLWLLYLTLKDFNNNMCFVHSGSLAYVSILSLIPMTVLIFSVAGLYGLGETVIEFTETNIFPYLVPEFHGQLSGWLENNISQDAFRNLGTTSVIGLIAITGLMMAGTAILVISERVFNEIWRVKKGGSYFRKLTGFWIFFTITPLLIVGNTYMKNFLMPDGGYMDMMIQQNTIIGFLYSRVLPFMITLFVMIMLNILLPRAKVLFKSALFGSIFSAFLWEFTKNYFYLYVMRMTAVTSFYGSLGIIPIFMIWMYLTWMIILLGAELTYTFQNRRLMTNLYRGYENALTHYTHAYLGISILIWMNSFYRRGKTIPSLDKFCDDLGVRLNTMTDVCQELVELEYLDPVRSEIPRFVFAQNPEYIHLNDVIDAMQKIEFSSEYGINNEKTPTGKHLSTETVFIEAQRSYLKPFRNKTVSDYKNL